jgi:hypothetical protein
MNGFRLVEQFKLFNETALDTEKKSCDINKIFLIA